MNKLAQDIYNILKTELSEITSKMVLEEKCKKISKDLDSLALEDMQRLVPLLLGPVLLFGGDRKAKAVKAKLVEMSKSEQV